MKILLVVAFWPRSSTSKVEGRTGGGLYKFHICVPLDAPSLLLSNHGSLWIFLLQRVVGLRLGLVLRNYKYMTNAIALYPNCHGIPSVGQLVSKASIEALEQRSSYTTRLAYNSGNLEQYSRD